MSRVNKGKTDLWTTRPDVASMLVDKELGYTISSVSQVCNGNASHHRHKHFRFID